MSTQSRPVSAGRMTGGTLSGLRPRSREQRDTLFVLALIAWTVAPHTLTLAPWVGLLGAGVLLWRAWLSWTGRPLPRRMWPLLFLLLAVGLTWWTERTLLGQRAGITLLVVLMALKTLELRARRDALVVFFLGFFLVLTQFLESQSLWTALAMLLSVWGWLTALTLAHMPAGWPRLSQAAGASARATLWGLPVMALLFVTFPRLGPLWNMPGPQARTGLSDRLRLGEVADLANDDRVALRLRFDGPSPPRSQWYFRGPVLSLYDGQQWTADDRPDATRDDAQARRQPPATFGYQMTVEPLRLAWLPLLEGSQRPDELNPPLGLPPRPDQDGQWRLPRPLAERVRLHSTTVGEVLREPGLSARRRAMLLQLPEGQHPATQAWARRLGARSDLAAADATTHVAAVLAHIRTAPFIYTLSPGTSEGDVIDQFWLDRRTGFCEHYAVALVVVLRAMGIPARVVTGYQGADAEPQDGWWVVRQSHAHAWVEYWQAGQGWLRADPTAAVAPERVQLGQSLRPPPGLVASALAAVTPGLGLRLQQWWERIDNRWNLWILGFDRSRQFQLFKDLGWPVVQPLDLIRVLGLCLALAAALGAAWAWWDRQHRSPWQRLRQRLCLVLPTLGVPAAPHHDPGDWAEALLARHGEAARDLAEQLFALQRLRYGPSAPHRLSGVDTTRWWRKFQQLQAASGLHRARTG